MELCDYMSGRRDTCCLLLSSTKAKEVSPARPSRLSKAAAKPTPLEELKHLPGQVESEGIESESSSDETEVDSESQLDRPKTPPKAVDPEPAHTEERSSEQPQEQAVPQRKKRRILDLRETTPNMNLPVEELRDLAVARARLIRLEAEEFALKQLVQNLQVQRDFCAAELADAQAKRPRLFEEFQECLQAECEVRFPDLEGSSDPEGDLLYRLFDFLPRWRKVASVQ
eukprot:symbB.v1.2.022035.t1/scaffold1936.1/size153520/9